MIDVSSLKTMVESLPHAAAVLSPDGGFIHENFDFRSLRIQAVPKLSRNGFFATFSTNGPKLRCLMENLDQGVWDHNLQTGISVASRSWHALRGFDPDHLVNRRALDQAAGDLFNRLDNTRRYAGMQIDLDHFKDVNDTLGHPAGDFVLSRVGRILKKIVQDHVSSYRVGGDEFTILFDEAPDKSTLNAICERLIDAVSVPMEFEGQPCSVGVSIGYAIGTGPPKPQSSTLSRTRGRTCATRLARIRSCVFSNRNMMPKRWMWSAPKRCSGGNVPNVACWHRVNFCPTPLMRACLRRLMNTCSCTWRASRRNGRDRA